MFIIPENRVRSTIAGFVMQVVDAKRVIEENEAMIDALRRSGSSNGPFADDAVDVEERINQLRDEIAGKRRYEESIMQMFVEPIIEAQFIEAEVDWLEKHIQLPD